MYDELLEVDDESFQRPNMSEEKKTEAVKETATEKASKKKEAPKKAQVQYTRTAKGKKRVVKSVPKGKVYITASLNNTIITATDLNGNAVAWASAGGSGFRGPKKATPYAASKVVDKIAEKLEALGMKEMSIVVNGVGNGRDSSIRSLNSKGFTITGIKEITPVPHNGCRPRRPRRV